MDAAENAFVMGPPLWTHPDPTQTRLWEFKTHIEQKYGESFADYEALRQWSIKNIGPLWSEVWHFTGVVASEPFTEVLAKDAAMFPRPTFFQSAKLNFAENLLYPKCITDEDSLAVIASTEVARENVTWKQLRERVRQCTDALKSIGVGEGDRVAGYVANHTNALVAMLAATSIGAIWTGVSPDTGVFAVLDRVQQIQPVVLFSDNAVIYNGKTHGVQEKLQEIVLGLSSLAALIVFPSVPDHNLDFNLFKPAQIQTWNFADFLSHTPSTAPNTKQCFAQFSPDHPVYILYSSGTTGKPKAIVHSAAGTLLQHKKEHDIHCDIRPGSRLFYFTTTTWMMWHWLLSGLATGATLILYDGSPFRSLNNPNTDHLAMPRLINDLSITHFGTSAKYLSILEQKNVSPDPMPSLQAIYSTGSPLAPSTFAYVYRAFGPNINLASITGGTDIISLFGAPSPISPVYAGEIQIRALGMDVLVYDFAGKDITLTGEAGDLVCVKPFPCQPIYFWGPEGNAKYKKSYFDTFPGIWHHGDFVRINPKTGGMFMLGRSDGTLKPSGVRFGSAEIYNIVLQDFPEVDDALCIGRRRETDVDETVVLFLKMVEGQKFDEGLAKRIKGVVREKLTARHVPAIVDECPEIPVTMNGKKVEIAVKQILSGMNIKISASVANAECLDWYREWSEKHQDAKEEVKGDLKKDVQGAAKEEGKEDVKN